MHFKGLDLNLLVALDALLSERNVTRAAERIHLSQPGMSAALQKLRWHFSDQLLERVGRRLDLTPRARDLVEPVRDILFRVGHLIDHEPDFDPRTAKRVFRLAMSNVGSEVLAAPLAEKLLEIAPGISCQFDDLNSNALTRLNDGQYDICVTIAERTLLDPTYVEDALAEEFLFNDYFVLVAAAGNAALTDDISYADFCKLPYVEIRFGGDLVSAIEQTLVSRTRLVAAVPWRIFNLYRTSLKLRFAPLPFKAQDLDETAVWHIRHQDDPGHRFFRQVLKEVASSLD
jgi:LysR family nod box-dependent transcriptional activator